MSQFAPLSVSSTWLLDAGSCSGTRQLTETAIPRFDQMNALEHKVIIVTGAATGIGHGTAGVLARQGARVVLADVNAEGVEAAAEVLRQDGHAAVSCAVDVTSEDSVAELVRFTTSTYGRLDGAFNNAAIRGPEALTQDIGLADWEHTLRVNLTGTWLCMKHEIPAMLASGGGAIVNTSSGAGLVGLESSAPYVASKHAVIGITRTAALEYARDNLRVNAICPAVIRTPMVDAFIDGDTALQTTWDSMQPIGRMGRPEEVGSVVAYLLSDASALVTGSALAVDGGLFAQAYGGHRNA